jgi:hypothetical protein
MPFLNLNNEMKSYPTPHSLGTAARLGFMVKAVGFSIDLFVSGLFLGIFLRLFRVVFRAEGPPTCITLFTPWGSNLMTLGFTMLAATVYLPTPSVPGK